MKAIFLVFCSLFMLFALPQAFELIDDARSDEYSPTFAGITTGAGEYSSNFTLPKSLYSNSLIFVTDLSSNVTADAPSAASYNTVSRLLSVNGLEQNETRTISLTYRILSDSMDDFMRDGVLPLFRWLYVFMILGMFAGSIYCFFTN